MEKKRFFSAIELICEGQAGHGSLMQENSSGEKVQYMLNKFMDLRKCELNKLKDNPELKVGDVSAINLTMLKGGMQTNCVPAVMNLTFDIRLAIDVDHDAFEQQVKTKLKTQILKKNIFKFVILIDKTMVCRSWRWHNNKANIERCRSINYKNRS